MEARNADRLEDSPPILSGLKNLLSNLRTNDVTMPLDSKNMLKKIFRDSTTEDSTQDSSQESTTEDIDVNPKLLSNENPIHFKIPQILLSDGLSLLKVSHKSKKRIYFKIDSKKFDFSYSIASKLKLVVFLLDDIKSVFVGSSAAPYREELHISKDFETKWITIIYFNSKKERYKNLHLIADNVHDFKKLHSAIANLKLLREELGKQWFIDFSQADNPLKDMVLGKDSSGKEFEKSLTFQDIVKYSRRLNVGVNQDFLRRIFDQASEGDDLLNFDQFKHFVSILKVRDDITSIYGYLTNDKMDYNQFKLFMVNVQKETFDEEHLAKVFKKFSTEQYWSPQGLNNFLMSKYSPYISDTHEESYYDRPFNDYFISSSHNTYLIGRQVAGESSVDGYIRALKKGCKSLEVDVWDGSEENEEEPIVSHGRTFTTSISFTNVIKTIKKYAFITSSLPVVISLETHCSVTNQLKMVKVLKEVLGDSLILHSAEWSVTLPSPLLMKNKFLIKVKKTSDQLKNSTTKSSTSTSATTTSFSEDTEKRSRILIRRRSSKVKITPELSDLGVYIQGVKFTNFSLPESKTFNHIFLLSENSINSMLKDDSKRTAVDKHNRKFLMRVYPSKIRVKLSNFIPIIYWSYGAQMVATNWQTYDLGQQINESLFANKMGYVLKPSDLRKPVLKSGKFSLQVNRTRSELLKALLLLKSTLEPALSSKPLRVSQIKFRITIISAHQLPKPKGEKPVNSFVSFEITGGANTTITWDDPKMSLCKTSVVAENGFNPIWNQSFSGRISTLNDLVFIKFTVASQQPDDEIIPLGLMVAKLGNLKQGYRYLPMHDMFGEELIYSSVFARIEYIE